MAMSEKNESYLFDLLESINQSLRAIRFAVFGFGLAISLLCLAIAIAIA
jgi:hypothetical protein